MKDVAIFLLTLALGFAGFVIYLERKQRDMYLEVIQELYVKYQDCKVGIK